jgi:hypothetical protein
MPNLQIVALFALRELGKHGFRIDIPHQLADILPLPDLRSVRGQTAQVAQCNEQVVRQVERLDLLVGKGREFHAQLLQGCGVAFARALALALLLGLAGSVGFVLYRHIAHAITGAR